MEKKIEICANNSLFGGGSVELTLSIPDGSSVVLDLNEKAWYLLDARFKRSFYLRCPKAKMIEMIDKAKNAGELEEIARKYFLCDMCRFADINIFGMKRVLKVVVETLYKYPKLRSKMNFIGSHQSLTKEIAKIEAGDRDALKELGLQHILDAENAAKFGRLMRLHMDGVVKMEDVYVATAMNAFGIMDSLLLDKNDFEGYAYISFMSLLRQNVAVGFHPQGCEMPESVVYHELGHLLDYYCGLSSNAEFKKYHSSLSRAEIKNGLSEYALTSGEEFIAEAFSESMCNKTPRPIATKVSALLEQAYKNARP